MKEVLDLLSQLPYGGISFAGLVTLVIILIFRGEIMPKSTVEKLIVGYEATIAAKTEENEKLREAYNMSEEARRLGAESDKELLVLGRTTVHILQSIHEQANPKGGNS